MSDYMRTLDESEIALLKNRRGSSRTVYTEISKFIEDPNASAVEILWGNLGYKSAGSALSSVKMVISRHYPDRKIKCSCRKGRLYVIKTDDD